MRDSQKKTSRKKFLLWTTALVGSITAFKIFGTNKNKPTTVRMLTEDGRLVEVDTSQVTKGRKISNKELQDWVKK